MDARVTHAIDQMQNRLGERLTVPELATQAGLSTSRFAHLFRAAVGVSPMRYLQLLRLKRAQLLLQDTSASVREVMAQVGYSDPSHFARDFRRHHGVNPRHRRIAR
jgi:transcriptional regulator GlxA family with amidase domain